MSYAHTIVYITSSPDDADKFTAIIDSWHPRMGTRNYTVKPLKCQGPDGLSFVFYLSLPGAPDDLFEVLRNEVWLGHTVYWHEADDSVGPEIVVCGECIHHFIHQKTR